MSGRGRKSLSELRSDVEKGEQRKKYYENEIRIKQREIKKLTRGERTHKFYSGTIFAKRLWLSLGFTG